MKTPSLYCLTPPLFKFYPPPPYNFLSLPIRTPTALSVVVFLWLNGWLCHIWCAILLNHNMDPWYVKPCYLSTRSLLRSDTQYGLLLVLWFDITYTITQIHTAHSGAKRVTHPLKYIFTPPVMCSQQLPL